MNDFVNKRTEVDRAMATHVAVAWPETDAQNLTDGDEIRDRSATVRINVVDFRLFQM